MLICQRGEKKGRRTRGEGGEREGGWRRERGEKGKEGERLGGEIERGLGKGKREKERSAGGGGMLEKREKGDWR